MVHEHRLAHASQWAAVVSIAAKIGCTAQTLLNWVNKAEVAAGRKPGISSEMSERVKALERENREMR
jgi:transposase-like protein